MSVASPEITPPIRVSEVVVASIKEIQDHAKESPSAALADAIGEIESEIESGTINKVHIISAIVLAVVSVIGSVLGVWFGIHQ